MLKIPLEELGFILPPLAISAWISNKVLDAMAKLGKKAITSVLPLSAGELSDLVFGIKTGGLAPSNGINKWPSRNNPKLNFGEIPNIDSGFAAPPYDLLGIKKVKEHIGNFNEFVPKGNNQIVKVDSNLLLIGGNINRQLIEFRNSLKYDLPLVFKDINLIPKKYRPNRLEEIERHFTDIDGHAYTKISKATKVLIDKTDSSIPPIGPYVSADGKIESDVVLLSVLPAPNGKRAILVQPGYGAGSRLDDLLFNGNILGKIYEVVRKEAYPWFQAAFFVKVEPKGYHEYYDIPELRRIISLKNI